MVEVPVKLHCIGKTTSTKILTDMTLAIAMEKHYAASLILNVGISTGQCQKLHAIKIKDQYQE